MGRLGEKHVQQCALKYEVMDIALIFVKGVFEETYRNFYALDWIEQEIRRVLEMDKCHHIRSLVTFRFSRKGFILVYKHFK